MTKPTVRAESILDGIFAQAVVVVEAEGDRTVYQATWETLVREVRLDIHFATVGGTGGIADTCTLYSALKIPVAVISDLDLLADNDRLRRILDALGAKDGEGLTNAASELISNVKNLPPTISEEEVRRRILDAMPDDLSWVTGGDSTLRRTLLQLSRKLNRMRRLKTASSEPLPTEIAAPLKTLIADLHSNGLFIVPVGDLEEWLAHRNIQASKNNKWAWANEAASVIRELGAQPEDVWQFFGSVGNYLQARLDESAA